MRSHSHKSYRKAARRKFKLNIEQTDRPVCLDQLIVCFALLHVIEASGLKKHKATQITLKLMAGS